ncbi:MAG: hypothetical protein AVDCRST_MAG88-4179 [uncultured Thermomicrobiales bacterium]|uniref:Uncharacterized protein n=1 Tax=uncultured Thermomicrobiales bacterium TaxID=1645740 RepID=A0A6J4VRY8_9BACT|nr:MAG: hypothetical protein AVDCRST_MAG88-4179 [uncultured Thermomicrobiales bacterium]
MLEYGDTTNRWWMLALSIGAVVIGVVAALLLRIIRAASSIDRYAADIWDAGQKIAGNTASIWMLGQTNSVAGQILATAQSIDKHAAAIDQALNGAKPSEPATTSATGSASVQPGAE